jgi:hypothetical protein
MKPSAPFDALVANCLSGLEFVMRLGCNTVCHAEHLFHLHVQAITDLSRSAAGPDHVLHTVNGVRRRTLRQLRMRDPVGDELVTLAFKTLELNTAAWQQWCLHFEGELNRTGRAALTRTLGAMQRAPIAADLIAASTACTLAATDRNLAEIRQALQDLSSTRY